MKHRIHREGKRLRYRKRVRGGHIINDIMQIGKHGLQSVKRAVVHGVPGYIPILKNAVNGLFQHTQNIARNAVSHSGEGRVHKKHLGQAERVNAIRRAMTSRVSGRGLKSIY